MLNKPFKSYVSRRLQNYEELQINKFSEISNKIYGDFPEGDYEVDGLGFIIPCEDSYMKVLIEQNYQGYKLVNLVDLAERKSNNSIWCLISEEAYLKNGLKDKFNVCIRFSGFKKLFFCYDSVSTGYKGKWSCMMLQSFEIINPIRLRLLSKRESSDVSDIRNEILFKYLDEDTNPYLKLAVLNTLFLAPKIDSKNGIESYSLIEKSNFRYSINLDNYNSLLKMMVPPEISNNHYDIYSPSSINYTSKAYGEKLAAYSGYPMDYYKYDAVLNPTDIENDLEKFRTLENGEVGITTQTNISSFNDKKTVLDKLQQSEFYFLQQNFPLYAITNLSRPKKLILENEELLYTDYANRMTISLEKKPISISAQKKIKELVKESLELQGYHAKDSDDQYVNNKVRGLMGNLNRVRTTLQRSNTLLDSNLESTYLESLETSLRDITQSREFNRLANKPVNTKIIQMLRNDVIKIQIINVVELKGGRSSEDEIVGTLIKEGFEIKDILKRIIELEKMGLIYKRDNKLCLTKGQI